MRLASRSLFTLLRPTTRCCMPQLTLFSDPRSKSLSLSPQKPLSTPSKSRTAGWGDKGRQPDLWKLHHEEEDMAAANKARAKAKLNGKEVKMHDDEDDLHEVKDEEGEMTGQPDRGKRKHSPEGGGVAGARDTKRHKNAYEISGSSAQVVGTKGKADGQEGKVASADVAAAVDADPPLDQLMRLAKDKEGQVQPEKGDSVVYWMRMEDMRVEDNTALRRASEKAKELGVPLVALFVLSPGDYKIHDRSAKRIDFILRTLRWLKPKFDELNIPFYIASYDRRLQIPRRIITELMPKFGAHHLFCNIEYEVDELRRDIATVKSGRKNGVRVECFHDRLVVPPGRITSQARKPMSVFSPWQRQWARIVDKEPNLLKLSPLPEANSKAVREGKLKGLFDESQIPNDIDGFELQDAEKVRECWPEGTDRAKELLDRFLHTKARKEQLQLVSPLRDGAEKDDKRSRVQEYQTGRNLVDGDNSSRLSPYLASGVISGRMVLNEAKKLGKGGKLESGRDTGVGMWVQEVSWRDFYNHVMATWPRVSMGRPFLEKFADVQWEINEEHLQAWKDGKTGFPIVDAAMRACKARGWMENRVRMVAASFLVKSLMIDWRLGEKHFMECFIDGDLAANNGGWQWTASTGTDPQPYFRIFNTLTQSEKCDPNGDYIRYWVPELKNLKGKAVHDPSHNMPSGEFKKLGYPAPIVDHKASRERALFRYKNVGEKEGEE